MRRKILAAVLIFTMVTGAGCSGKDSDETSGAAGSAIESTGESAAADITDYQGRFDLWSSQRTAYMMEEGAQAERTPGSGTDADGNEYESYFISADEGTYRSIEVVFDKNTNDEKHYEFYDVADDMMYLIMTTVSTDSTGNLLMDIYKYVMVNGTDVYAVDSDLDGQVTYTLLEDDQAPSSYRTFDEVISAYAG